MRCTKALLFLMMMITLSSCYHTKVTTGLEPSARVYDKAFASSWIGGLIPPPEVKAAEECPNGVAIVESELSFVNMLVGFLTAGIYTPMHIKVTCAAASGMSSAGGESMLIPKNSTEDVVIETFKEASEKASKTNQPVFVRFE